MNKNEEFIYDGTLVKKNKKSNHKGVFTFFMSMMALVSLVLGFLIFARSNPNGTVFGIKMADVNNAVSRLFSNMFSFNIFKSNDKTTQVDTQVSYISLGEGKFISDDGSVRSLYNGTVNYVEKVEEDNYLVVMSYDNGIVASYYNLTDIMIKNNDRLKSNDIIGNYETSFNAVFMKDDQVIPYGKF